MAINTKSAPAETQEADFFSPTTILPSVPRPTPQPAPFPCCKHSVSSFLPPGLCGFSIQPCLDRRLGPAPRPPLSWCKACEGRSVLDLACPPRPDHETALLVRAADYSTTVPAVYSSQHLFGKLSVFLSIRPAHAALRPPDAVSSCLFKPFSPSLPLQHVSLPFPTAAPAFPLSPCRVCRRLLGVPGPARLSASRLFLPRWPGHGCPEPSIDQPHLPQATRDSPRTLPKVRGIGKSGAVEHLLAIPGALSPQSGPSGFSAPSLPVVRPAIRHHSLSVLGGRLPSPLT